MSKLFSQYRLRDLVLGNRTVVSPMCQYSALDGLANDWHFVHLGRFALGGFGLVIVEATAVTPEGRITYGDLGLWNDSQIEPLRRIAAFCSGFGQLKVLRSLATKAAYFFGRLPNTVGSQAEKAAALEISLRVG